MSRTSRPIVRKTPGTVPSVQDLRYEAREIRDSDPNLTPNAALDAAAQRHGYVDYPTAQKEIGEREKYVQKLEARIHTANELVRKMRPREAIPTLDEAVENLGRWTDYANRAWAHLNAGSLMGRDYEGRSEMPAAVLKNHDGQLRQAIDDYSAAMDLIAGESEEKARSSWPELQLRQAQAWLLLGDAAKAAKLADSLYEDMMRKQASGAIAFRTMTADELAAELVTLRLAAKAEAGVVSQQDFDDLTLVGDQQGNSDLIGHAIVILINTGHKEMARAYLQSFQDGKAKRPPRPIQH